SGKFFRFNYFFGFDEENGILYFLSSFGLLAVVRIRNSEDIEYQVIEARHKFIKDDKYLFVCAIGLFATENERQFSNKLINPEISLFPITAPNFLRFGQ